MKAIAATLLILAPILTIHFANGTSSPDRPAGIDARNWIPVSDEMAFVDTSLHPFPPSGRDARASDGRLFYDSQPQRLAPDHPSRPTQGAGYVKLMFPHEPSFGARMYARGGFGA
jgi:hypothetical protein